MMNTIIVYKIIQNDSLNKIIKNPKYKIIIAIFKV